MNERQYELKYARIQYSPLSIDPPEPCFFTGSGVSVNPKET